MTDQDLREETERLLALPSREWKVSETIAAAHGVLRAWMDEADSADQLLELQRDIIGALQLDRKLAQKVIEAARATDTNDSDWHRALGEALAEYDAEAEMAPLKGNESGK